MSELVQSLPAATDGRLGLVLLLPLLGALLGGIFGPWIERRFGRRVVPVLACAIMVVTTSLALGVVARLLELPAGAVLSQRLWTLVRVGGLEVDLALALDALSATFVVVVTVVSTLIHVYATGYMREDSSPWRFFAYLNLFVFSMLLLVLADSILLCFFGWEGVGLCSYLLIGYWYGEAANLRAAKKAFVVNRVGDVGFLLGFFLLFAGLGGAFHAGPRVLTSTEARSPSAIAVTAPAQPTPTNFRTLAALLSPTAESAATASPPSPARLLAESRVWGLPLLLLVGLAFFLGMSGKSAQIPLYVWLPDAMAGPTPVSALIHAATMVTAGVYLGARLFPLFALSAGVLTVFAVLGLGTALLGAVLAATAQDIKKVLAFSTISQLGFMFLALGVGAPEAAVFHVVTHACFKACLFLAAGSVIHAMHGVVAHASQAGLAESRLHPDPTDPQDMRNMGGLGAFLPRTRWAFALGAVALAGLPLGAGFFSKDEILWRTFGQSVLPIPGVWLWAVASLTAALTAFYAFRAYYLVFAGTAKPRAAVGEPRVHEAPWSMLAPLLLLAAASILSGPLLGWPEAWGGHPIVPAFLHAAAAALSPATVEAGAVHPAGGSTVFFVQGVGIVLALLGFWGARALYRDLRDTHPRLLRWRNRLGRLHAFVWSGYQVDAVYHRLFVVPVGWLARVATAFDRRAVDGLVEAVARAVRRLGAALAWMDGAVVDGIVRGVSHLCLAGGRKLQLVQTGRINHYVLAITLGTGLVVFVAWISR